MKIMFFKECKPCGVNLNNINLIKNYQKNMRLSKLLECDITEPPHFQIPHCDMKATNVRSLKQVEIGLAYAIEIPKNSLTIHER